MFTMPDAALEKEIISLNILIEVADSDPPPSVAEWLHFLLWHETYHLGNLEILRQLAGKNDEVI